MMTLSPNVFCSKSAIPVLTFVSIVACCLAIYWPGLSGIFLLDDYHNLSALNNNGGVTDRNSFLAFVFGNNSGTVGRPISMLSFLIDDQAWPGSPRSFKYTNLMIHILCGLLIIALTYRMAIAVKTNNNTAMSLALMCGAFWLFHPLNVSTTLYVIQRMTQLVTLFMLAGSLSYFHGRQIYDQKPVQSLVFMTLGIAFFGSLALLSKENGALLIVYILTIEITFFYGLNRNVRFKIWFAAFILIPLSLMVAYFASRGFYINAYDMRDYTFGQRLLTESRIIVDYIFSIIIPPSSGTGLVHDDVIVSTGLFSPFTTSLSVIFNLTLLGSALYFRKQQPVYAFAVFWFYGGHILESSFIPLELYFEHRNYLPMMGPIFGVFYYLIQLSQYLGKARFAKLIMLIPAILIFMSIAFTYQSARIWSNPNSLFAVWAYEHPGSLRAQRIYAQSLAINSKPEEAITLLSKTYENFSYDISLPLEIINLSCIHNMESPYQLKELGNLSMTAKFTDGVWTITKNFVDNIVKGKCKRYNLTDAISLLAHLETIDKIELYEKTFAQILFLHSDLYVLNRQLAPAIELLDRAYKYQKSVTVPLRQAELLISAGLFQDAAHYISLAKQTNSVRKMFTPSKIEQISALESTIKANL